MTVKVSINWRGKLLATLFSCFSALIVYGIWAWLSQPIADQNGNEFDMAVKLPIAALMAVVGFGWLKLAVEMLLRLITKRGGLTLTENGIEDTFAVFAFLAFWTAFRVRVIPWSAVSGYEYSDSALKLTIDPTRLPNESGGFFARKILTSVGYIYQFSNMSEEEWKEILNHYLPEQSTLTQPFGKEE